MRRLIVILFTMSCAGIAGQHPLENCRKKLSGSLNSGFLELTVQEKSAELFHTLHPWHETRYVTKSRIWINEFRMEKSDTVRRVGAARSTTSALVYEKNRLLRLREGEKSVGNVKESDLEQQLLKTARISPIAIVKWMADRQPDVKTENKSGYFLCQSSLGSTTVSIAFSKNSWLPDFISTLQHDDLHGDVSTIFGYSNYQPTSAVWVPRQILIKKINGRVTDTVNVTHAALAQSAPGLLQAPDGYQVTKDQIAAPVVKTWKYAENIYFVDQPHTGIQSLVAEFDDFVFVAESPLSSENGDRLLSEVYKICPGKPIRYFSFGHYHPHYTGGMRPFVHCGAKIICCASDSAYVRYLSTAPHTIQPDSLQNSGKTVIMEFVSDRLVINSGGREVHVIFMGEKSAHTNDYLLYYFPKEKLLFEGDMVWIPKKGDVPAAGKSQQGLYQLIRDLNLEVDTIVQSWQTGESGYKTTISFSELEASARSTAR